LWHCWEPRGTRAQKNSPLAVNARGQVRASQAGVRSAYAAFLPDIGAHGSANEKPAPGKRLGPASSSCRCG
jgi:outer membrane protein TolC